jgi:hypothetical protein
MFLPRAFRFMARLNEDGSLSHDLSVSGMNRPLQPVNCRFSA